MNCSRHAEAAATARASAAPPLPNTSWGTRRNARSAAIATIGPQKRNLIRFILLALQEESRDLTCFIPATCRRDDSLTTEAAVNGQAATVSAPGTGAIA